MSKDEDLSHIERALKRLESHVADQDAEIFRLSQRVDSLQKRLKQLEDRQEGTPGSDGGTNPIDEKPPHY